VPSFMKKNLKWFSSSLSGACGTVYVACGMWHVACGMWHVVCDVWCVCALALHTASHTQYLISSEQK